jgi:hypothetical protein
VRLIQRVAEHYDTQEIEFGRIYRWCPERVVVECYCGERMTLRRLDIIIASELTCEECGAKVSPRIREEVVIELLDEDDAAIHPGIMTIKPKQNNTCMTKLLTLRTPPGASTTSPRRAL